MQEPLHRPELLSPAGDWDALRAAVANGADAVYFGLTKYSARQRATNFTRDELPETIAYLHGHNVRGYVALNTLIFSDELAEAADLAAAIAQAGADAAIVQDLGLVRLIRRLAPTLPIHASTQMTLTEPRGIEFVRGLGVERVILARELSLAQIGLIRQATPMALEVFVHGALCMSYSGQCLASEALWGRSANRGQCAQACRLPYRLIVDGRTRDLGDCRYPLSTQDLAAYDRIADLVRLGVAGFKIEGRLKSAPYVAAATQVYRAAIDAALAGRPFRLPQRGGQALAQSFSRGFTHGHLDGVRRGDLVHGRMPKSLGIFIGTVAGRTGRGIVVQLDGAAPRGAAGGPLRPGDGVVFHGGRPDAAEQGGRVFAVEKKGPGNLLLTFGRGDVNLAAVAAGCTVWKTDDPALERELKKSFAREAIARRVPVSVCVEARVGGPLLVTVADDAGNRAEVSWPGPLAEATRQPLTEQLVREQLGRLGDTPFELAEVRIIGQGGAPVPTAPVLAPKSVLNDLRRQAVRQLMAARQDNARHAVADPGALDAIRREMAERCAADARREAPPPSLCVLVRTAEQLDAALAWRPDEGLGRPAAVYCDFRNPGESADAVARLRAAGLPAGLATLRIAKPGDEKFLQLILESGPDVVLVRHLAALSFFRENAPALPLVADFSLNAANEISADLLAAAPVARITPSLDLNRAQLAALMGRFPPARLEPIVHLHVPMMYTEHCIAAAHLSGARGGRECGRPCEKHRLHLATNAGPEHPLASDARCGTTLFAGVVQSAIEYVPEMLAAGVRCFRIEFLDESAAEARAILDLYSRALAGRVPPHDAWEDLRRLVPGGTTRGTWDFD